MSITTQSGAPKLKLVTFRMSEDLRVRLKIAAARAGCSSQDVVVAAVTAHLPKLEQAVSSERPAHKKK